MHSFNGSRFVVSAGIVLLLVGAGLAIALLFNASGPSALSLPPADPSIPAQGLAGGPSRLWALAAGICAAGGAALVGLGLTRSRRLGMTEPR